MGCYYNILPCIGMSLALISRLPGSELTILLPRLLVAFSNLGSVEMVDDSGDNRSGKKT